jgi:hypothetical protein
MYLIRERFFRLGEDSHITDEHGRPVLHVDGKVLTCPTGWSLVTPKGEKWPRSSGSWWQCDPSESRSGSPDGQVFAALSIRPGPWHRPVPGLRFLCTTAPLDLTAP